MGDGKDMKKTEDFISEAIENINEDRSLTKTLLVDLLVYIKKSDENHRNVGLIAAKYVETLQRSNEQLVKLASLMQKRQSGKSAELTEEDKTEIFDLIQGGEKNVGSS
tara:strand:- start:1346 stop:1669 length:324 start_codon:yes stop_codon:yes gene_type:complete